MTLRVQVAVIGAGPVGSALAVDLGQRGTRTLVVDRRRTIEDRGLSPRAREYNVRTTAHLRRWGALARFRDLSPFPGDRYPSDVAFLTSMTGYEITRVEDAFFHKPDPTDLYPEPAIGAQQWQFELALHEALERCPTVEPRYGWELETLEDTGACVQLRIRNIETQQPEYVEASYVVGCDGASSTVRRLLGVQMQGQFAVAPNAQIIFRAPDFWRGHDKPFASMYWILQPVGIGGFMLPVDTVDRVILSTQRLNEESTLDEAQLIRKVQLAYGHDLAVDILGVDRYFAHSVLADHFRFGNVFLAGDAGHMHPAYGGHALNLGISDAADLGWKLAAVAAGWASDGLLDSYEQERRPVALHLVEEATRLYSVPPSGLVRPGMDDPTCDGAAVRQHLAQEILTTKREQFRTLGTQLGYTYAESPHVVADGTPPPPWTVHTYTPSASPGAIAPHGWLGDGTSLYDHFGAWFTLLRLRPSSGGGDLLQQAAARRGIPLRIVDIDDVRLRELYAADCALIRPDQHVAWRGNAQSTAGDAVWNTVLGDMEGHPRS